MCSGNVDFGATSVYPSAKDLQSLVDIKLLPVALYATAPAYNVNSRKYHHTTTVLSLILI